MSTAASGRDRVYSGWRRERYGWFMGLTGWQAVLSGAALMPLLLAVSNGVWLLALKIAPASAVGVLLVALPVRGRPSVRWLVDLYLYLWGRVMGWSRWRSRASTGLTTRRELATLDLPGVIAGLRLHDGPPFGPMLQRVCVIHDPRSGQWASVAQISHPGLGAVDEATRNAFADQLGALLAAAARGEQVSRISILVRTVPDDGAERAAWVADHVSTHAPGIVRDISRQLEQAVVAAAVRHEVYVTVGVSEGRIRRTAQQAGGGLEGRARVLYRHLQEVENHLRGLGVTGVRWLHTEDVAAAIRTGYNLAETPALEQAKQEQARGLPTLTGLPLGVAGPVTAPPPAPRSYTHDAFTTVSYTLLLPELPTRVGSLARMLAPAEPGERRTLALHYEPQNPASAGRQVERDVWTAEMAAEVRRTRGFRVGQAHRRREAEIAVHESQVVAGHTMVRVAGAVAVTVPSSWPVEDHAANLEATARACQFRLLRLELAQDSGFVAACLPLGVGLPSRSWG
ncbi:SCO6880 family protein [Dactylosporangium sp. AC04546]|uniref:SCO6880 family protein n=1 Tax=Dactylosporangium sp. AC04546 TaxID=2862460 RepID=UPI001EE13B18|nr:SCO6880 family protein [Dactylosporangium sp. AC04546]WVK89048.1 SCO6880 family protein [Dactylosporangium sp. AC04546]